MILKFQKQGYKHIPEPKSGPHAVNRVPAGPHWIVFGEVSEVEYGEGDKFEIEESDLDNNGLFSRSGIAFDPCVVIHDETQDCPIYKLIWFRQNGMQKVGRTQLPVYLCSDKGDTIEKL